METYTRQHRRHDSNPPAGRRGTFKNKTWVSGGRGHGRGKGVSEVAAWVDGTDTSPSDEPLLETLEERERYYQEVSPHDSYYPRRPAKKQGHLRALNLARQNPRGGEEEGYRGGQDGRPASPEASRRGYYHGRDMYGYVPEVRTVSSGTGKQPVQLGSCAYPPRVFGQHRNLQLMSQRKIPGTKRVDHQRAVKMYERAAGDKTMPSDLRPPPVLKVRSRI
jgi:hypothetical protein